MKKKRIFFKFYTRRLFATQSHWAFALLLCVGGERDLSAANSCTLSAGLIPIPASGFTWGPNGSSDFFISNNGNIGIGTTSTPAALNIVGTDSAPLLTVKNSAGRNLMQVAGTTTTPGGDIQFGLPPTTGISGTQQLNLSTTTAATTTTIDHDLTVYAQTTLNLKGNSGRTTQLAVGGTTALQLATPLTVGTGTPPAITSNSTPTLAIQSNPAPEQPALRIASSSSSSTPFLQVQKTGQIGIGKTPRQALDIVGTLALGQGGTYIRFTPSLLQSSSCSNGQIALSSSYIICVCNGSNRWLNLSTGATCS